MYKSKTEINIRKEDRLPQDWLISHPGLTRAQKINPIEFIIYMYYHNANITGH